MSFLLSFVSSLAVLIHVVSRFLITCFFFVGVLLETGFSIVKLGGFWAALIRFFVVALIRFIKLLFGPVFFLNDCFSFISKPRILLDFGITLAVLAKDRWRSALGLPRCCFFFLINSLLLAFLIVATHNFHL